MLRRDDEGPKERSHPIRGGFGWALAPVRRMWDSEDPLDAYGLVQMTAAAGDALLAVALAGSVFFSVPVGQARTKVALYLALTMAPLAAAAPLLVPLLDRGRYRRAISFVASFGRAGLAAYGASVLDSLVLFPVVFGALALSRVHAITRTGLVGAYAKDQRSLVGSNARLGRLGAVGALAAALPGIGVLKVGGAGAVLYLAAAAYGSAAALTVRLARPEHARADRVRAERDAAARSTKAPRRGSEPQPQTAGAEGRLGRVRSLAPPALGTAGLRGAQGFLLFLFAFALRAEHRPAWWFGVVLAAGIAGGFLGDVIAPIVRARIPEGPLVFGALLASGIAALWSALHPSLATLALLSGVSGAATEVGRLAFQSLMQSHAPAGRQGRVYVRYEVAFQLAWVLGAMTPAMIPIGLRAGTIVLAVAYGLLAVLYVVALSRSGSSSASGPS
jgi:hypothetical protein